MRTKRSGAIAGVIALCVCGCGASPPAPAMSSAPDDLDAACRGWDASADVDALSEDALALWNLCKVHLAGAPRGAGLDPARDAGCPATYAEAHSLRCGGPAACAYPEGRCECGTVPECSGIARAQQPERPLVWLCEDVPPAVRSDGCPGVGPVVGGACAGSLRCSYGACCFQEISCVGGTWTITGGGCPP